MTTRLSHRTARLALALLLASPLAPASDLADLQRNPHRIPETVKAKQEVSFASGLKIKAGDELRVQGIENGKLLLFPPGGSGLQGLLSLDPSGTTLLEDAAARFAAWTPEQQKLTLEDFKSRKDLWPFRVRIRQEQSFGDGVRFKPGESWTMTEYDGSNVTVLEPAKYALYNLAPGATDFFDQVIAAVKTPPPSRFLQELSEHAVRINTGEKANLLASDEPPYLAIYNAAGWCGYCTQTTPEVIKWYEESKARGDKSIELLLVSADKSEPEMKTHIEAKGFSGLTVPFGKDKPMFLLRETGVYNGLPNLIVVDRTGKVVIDSSNEMPLPRTQRTLAEMRQLQESHAAKEAQQGDSGSGGADEQK